MCASESFLETCRLRLFVVASLGPVEQIYHRSPCFSGVVRCLLLLQLLLLLLSVLWQFDCSYCVLSFARLLFFHPPSFFRTVDDATLALLLNSVRFSDLVNLSLEGCSALTAKSVPVLKKRCPRLETLLLTGCDQFTADDVLEITSNMKALKKIELYKVPTRTHLDSSVRSSVCFFIS